jgi:hypothetical protein
MVNKKSLAGVCVAAATMMIPVTQAAEHEAKWGISGWINEGITYYDDGVDSDVAQLSDNGTTLGSRITLNGSFMPAETNLTAGFEVILEVFSGDPYFANGTPVTPLLFSNQDNINTVNGADIGVLGSSVNIGGNWGKFTIGLQSMPTDNIAVLADPSGTIWSGISPVFRGNGFLIRGLGAGTTNRAWGDFLQCLTVPGLGIGLDCNGIYRNGVRYDLPAFGNFSVAVGWANDKVYDIAAKYSGELGGLTSNIHAGYAKNNDGGTNVNASESDVFQIQWGLLHPGTGLFGLATYQKENSDNATPGSGDSGDAWYFKGGIKKKWAAFGPTSLYIEYGLYNDQYGLANADGVSGSEVDRIGLAVDQEIGSRLRIYGKWKRLSLDVDGNATAQTLYGGAEDLNLFTLGFVVFY